MKNNFTVSLRATAKQSIDLYARGWIAASAFGLLAMTVFITLPVFAAEEETKQETKQEEVKENSDHTYSPDFCEFTVTFPGEPYKTQRCEDPEKKKCFEQISYTQVYDLSSTVNFRVICNKIDENVKDTYSGKVMQATLEAMTEQSIVKKFETSFREEKNYKQAGLVGEGKVGRLPTIYIAQLWIGQHSAFSVEAELIGAESHDADKLFSEILKSIYNKDEMKEKAGKEKAAGEEEQPAKEKPAESEKDTKPPAP